MIECKNSEGGRTTFEVLPMPKDFLGRAWKVDIRHLDYKGGSLGSSTLRFRTEEDANRYLAGITGARE